MVDLRVGQVTVPVPTDMAPPDSNRDRPSPPAPRRGKTPGDDLHRETATQGHHKQLSSSINSPLINEIMVIMCRLTALDDGSMLMVIKQYFTMGQPVLNLHINIMQPPSTID